MGEDNSLFIVPPDTWQVHLLLWSSNSLHPGFSTAASALILCKDLLDICIIWFLPGWSCTLGRPHVLITSRTLQQGCLAARTAWRSILAVGWSILCARRGLPAGRPCLWRLSCRTGGTVQWNLAAWWRTAWRAVIIVDDCSIVVTIFWKSKLSDCFVIFCLYLNALEHFFQVKCACLLLCNHFHFHNSSLFQSS